MGYYKIVSKIVSPNTHPHTFTYIHVVGHKSHQITYLMLKLVSLMKKMKQDVEKKLPTEHFQCFMPVMAMRLSKAYFCIWVHKCLLFELFFQCLLFGLKLFLTT